jgi:hypothetical protein
MFRPDKFLKNDFLQLFHTSFPIVNDLASVKTVLPVPITIQTNITFSIFIPPVVFYFLAV